MSIPLVAAVLALVAAVAGAGALTRRCVSAPRIDLVAWACAMGGLTLALAAQALGFARGFGPLTFRAVELGAALIAPLSLAWGLAEASAKSLGARFAARLALSGLAVVAGVILASDPLQSSAFTTAWPSASLHYRIVPNGVRTLVAAATLLTIVATLGAAALRSRGDPLWRARLSAAAPAGAAALVAEALGLHLPVNSAYPLLCAAAVALTWLTATRVGRLPLPAEDEREDWGRGAPGDAWFRDDTGGFRRGGADGGWLPDDTGGFRRGGADGGWLPDDTGGFRRGGADDLYEVHTGAFDPLSDVDGDGRRPTHAGPFREPPDGEPRGAGGFDEGDLRNGRGRPADAGADPSELYGQIAIYTLLDSRVEEFDRLARRVVERVRDAEPGAVVFVIHAVPSAPLQRILYQVYRDRAAYEEHGRQPHVQEFDAESKPHVLATNVIEVGVMQAKVMALNTPAAGDRDRGRRPGGGW